MMLHESVLVEEVLRYLAPKNGEVIVDGTVGAGGHAARILPFLGERGRLIGFDKDPDALKIAAETLEPFGQKAMLIRRNYKTIARNLAEAGVKSVDGVLLDLGVSSMQLDRADKGFSFKSDGPLDMRMDPAGPLTAEALVNKTSREKLEHILREFGEERFYKRITRAIIEARDRRPIRTTAELASVISGAVPGSYRHGRIHPATRSFQAIRIAVNEELESLETFLNDVRPSLNEGGRVVIISFHSLEDRIVKYAFRNFVKEESGRILTKKPIQAGDEESSSNPRARSAKLRAFLKTSVREDAR